MRTWLLDTGPLVAYLDASEEGHADVAGKVRPYVGRLATTSSVATEAMHVVSAAPDGPRLLAELLASWDVEIYDFTATRGLSDVVALMEQYANVPMDFADATLVLLAEMIDATDVLTLDRRGFATYRTRAGRAFQLVLDD